MEGGWIDKMVDISFIVLTYNPEWNQLIITLKSLIVQKNVNFEIVISDDGSKINYNDKLKKFFMDNNFTNYKFLNHSNNVGTCQNVYDGVKEATGKVVKLISPGDFLYCENIIYKWLQFLNDRKYDICFGKFIAYSKDSDDYNIIKVLEKPQLQGCYLKDNNYRSRKIACFLTYDMPIGATFIVNRELFIKYLSKIVGKVKYAEDFAYRLMVLDDIILGMYDKPVIFYEYGTGISTVKNGIWIKRLDDDLKQLKNIIIENTNDNIGFNSKYKKFLLINNKIKKMIYAVFYFPECLFRKIGLAISRKKTTTNTQASFLEQEIICK